MSAAAALVRTVAEFIDEHQLFKPADRLLLAASGGRDSTTLFHVLMELGYSVDLAHCNYGLRGDASDQDESFVKMLGERFAVRCHLTRTVIDSPTGVQLTAREQRYLYFEKILDEYNYDHLVTAHHLYDSLETSLINLLRGSGLTGLRGIPVKRGYIVRPLLSASPDLIAGYASERGLEWREDASNRSDHYLRNRIRHHLLPLLQELGLQDKTLARTLDRLRAESHLLDQAYDGWSSIVSHTGEGMVVERGPLTAEPRSVQLRLLAHFSRGQGWTPEQYRQMLTVSGSRLLQTTTHRVHVNPDRFTFYTLQLVEELPTVAIGALPFRHTFGDWEYTLECVPRPSILYEPGVLHIRLPEASPEAYSGQGLYLRPRRDGDVMAILGLNGKHKKVKKIVRELGLKAEDKSQLYLLTDDEGTVLAVVGYGIIAEQAAVQATDRLVLRVSRQRKSPETA